MESADGSATSNETGVRDVSKMLGASGVSKTPVAASFGRTTSLTESVERKLPSGEAARTTSAWLSGARSRAMVAIRLTSASGEPLSAYAAAGSELIESVATTATTHGPFLGVGPRSAEYASSATAISFIWSWKVLQQLAGELRISRSIAPGPMPVLSSSPAKWVMPGLGDEPSRLDCVRGYLLRAVFPSIGDDCRETTASKRSTTSDEMSPKLRCAPLVSQALIAVS